MDGLAGGWVSGWRVGEREWGQTGTDGRMHAWMNGWMWEGGLSGRLVGGWTRQVASWAGGRTDGPTYRHTDSQITE